MEKEIVLIGAGGHAAVIADIVFKTGNKLKGFLDDNIAVGTEVEGIPVLGPVSYCENLKDKLFLIAIGDNLTRRRIAKKYDLQYITLIHPTACIAGSARIESGTVVMGGAVINSRTAIGAHCVINTGAIVEHDNRIGDYVHISPNAALGGAVAIDIGAHIGIGATVRNNISICANAVIGAGSVVVRDIQSPGVYIGVPAREQRLSPVHQNSKRSGI